MVVQAYEKDKEDLLEFLRFKMAKVLEYNSALTPIQVYGDSVGTTVQKLHDFGIDRSFVPSCMGGDFCLDSKIAEWTRARLSIEELNKPIMNHKFLPGSTKGISGPLVKRKRDDKNETEESFCRKRNAVYARRMYHRRKLELLSLEEEVKGWRESNQTLRKECQRLEQLWMRAQQIVVGYELAKNTVTGIDQQNLSTMKNFGSDGCDALIKQNTFTNPKDPPESRRDHRHGYATNFTGKIETDHIPLANKMGTLKGATDECQPILPVTSSAEHTHPPANTNFSSIAFGATSVQVTCTESPEEIHMKRLPYQAVQIKKTDVLYNKTVERVDPTTCLPKLQSVCKDMVRSTADYPAIKKAQGPDFHTVTMQQPIASPTQVASSFHVAQPQNVNTSSGIPKNFHEDQFSFFPLSSSEKDDSESISSDNLDAYIDL